MTENDNIVLRVFEYGFYHAVEQWEDSNILKFPEPVVIYLDSATDIPEISVLILDFGEQGQFDYKVKNFVYQKHELRELNQKKMIILIPFQLLKLRKIIKDAPTPENFALLQNLILDDIIGSIRANLEVGNITQTDAEELKELTLRLYEHIYQHYEELGGRQNMKQLIEGALELPGDKYRNKIEELEEEILKIKQENETIKEEYQRLKKQLEE